MAGGTHGRVEATPSRTQIMMREPCAQTVVCAASRPAQQKQHATRRTKLLPNDMQKQQTNAALAKLLGFARVSKAEDQDTAQQLEERTEEHKSEHQSPMRISYAVLRLKNTQRQTRSPNT